MIMLNFNDFNLLKKEKDNIKEKDESKKTVQDYLIDLYALDDSEFLTLLPELKPKYKKNKKLYNLSEDTTLKNLEKIRKVRNAKILEEKEKKKDHLIKIGKFTEKSIKKLNDLELEIIFNEIRDLDEKMSLQKRLVFEEQLTDIEIAEIFSKYKLDFKYLEFVFSYIIEYGQFKSKFNVNKYLNSNTLSYKYYLNMFNVEPIYLFPSFKKVEEKKKKRLSDYEKMWNFKNLILKNKLQLNYDKDFFFFYKFIYFLFSSNCYIITSQKQHILWKQNSNIIFKDDLTLNFNFSKQYYSEIIQDILIEYLKYKHYKYPIYLWHLIFQDPILQKFINMFVKDGKKYKCESIFFKVFFILNFYYKKNPIYIFKLAIEKVRPFIYSRKIPFGKRTKVVPHPLDDKKQIKLAIKWLKEETFNNKSIIPFHLKVLNSLSNAIYSKGYSYNKMIQMHNEAYANRVYMYSNYYLRNSKVSHLREF